MLSVLGDNSSGKEAVVPLERAAEMGFGGGGSGPTQGDVYLDSQKVGTVLFKALRSQGDQRRRAQRQKGRVGVSSEPVDVLAYFVFFRLSSTA
jgi:hypothetical protein